MNIVGKFLYSVEELHISNMEENSQWILTPNFHSILFWEADYMRNSQNFLQLEGSKNILKIFLSFCKL